MKASRLFLVLFFVLPAFISTAQLKPKENTKSFRMGIALQGDLPTGDFFEFYSFGYGANLILEAKLAKSFSITGDLGYAAYTGKEVEEAEGMAKMSNMSVPSALLGLKFSSGIFYGEVRAGYYFGDMNELGLVPSIGFQFDGWDINIGMKALNEHYFGFLRVGYYFLNTHKKDPFCDSL